MTHRGFTFIIKAHRILKILKKKFKKMKKVVDKQQTL